MEPPGNVAAIVDHDFEGLTYKWRFEGFNTLPKPSFTLDGGISTLLPPDSPPDYFFSLS